VDYRKRQLERAIQASPGDVSLIEQYANILKQTGENPSNIELTDLILITYMKRYDVPHDVIDLRPDDVSHMQPLPSQHQIPFNKRDDRGGMAQFMVAIENDRVTLFNMPVSRPDNPHGEPEFIIYRAPQTLGILLRSIDSFVILDHRLYVERIKDILEFIEASHDILIDIRSSKRQKFGFYSRDYFNNKVHSHLFNLTFRKYRGGHAYRCELILRRLPFHDLLEFRILDNLMTSDGDVQNLALSGTRYQNYGLEHDEDDDTVFDTDVILGPEMLRERLEFYFVEMLEGLRLH